MDNSLTPDVLFTGEPRHSLDSKNRIALPSRWFKKGEEQKELYVMKHPRRACVMLYPPPVFRQVLDLAARDVEEPDKQQDLRRFFASKAHVVTTDKQRRLVLPEDVCRAAGLKTEVNVVGNADRIEVWDAAAWDAWSAQTSTTLSEETRHVPL